MISLVNNFSSGDSTKSRASLMLSLLPIWFILIISSPVSHSTPLSYRSTRMMTRENHPEKHQDELNSIDNLNSLNLPQNLLTEDVAKISEHSNKIEADDLKEIEKLNQFDNTLVKSLTQSLPAYFDPKLVYKGFVYNKRRKRELRIPRKIVSSPMQIKMPAYYPFIMAEMIPGSVKTRHPSIIAVNGCPAFFIADHKGRCRQVFQYTVRFGQNSPMSHDPIQAHHRTLFRDPVRQTEDRSYPNGSEPPPPPFSPRPVLRHNPSQPLSAFPRLLTLLRNAKRLDHSLLSRQNSSSSGEVTNEEGLDQLRRRILSALKTIRNRDVSKTSDSRNKEDFLAKATTSDYDD